MEKVTIHTDYGILQTNIAVLELLIAITQDACVYQKENLEIHEIYDSLLTDLYTSYLKNKLK